MQAWKDFGEGMTEEVGFEPTEACTSHDFQSCSLDHYETPPRQDPEDDLSLTERVGFEPTKVLPLPHFEGGSFDLSDISPQRSIT
jgi:hypothetical protein